MSSVSENTDNASDTGVASGDGGAAVSFQRRLVFWLLAGFILLGPALPQILDVHSVFLRPWIMYSGVGRGILDGEFHILRNGEIAERMSPLEILGLKTYPLGRHYSFEHQILSNADFRAYGDDICPGLKEGEKLAFEGAVGTADGWYRFSADDVCTFGLQGEEQ